MTVNRLLVTGLVSAFVVTAFALPVYAHHSNRQQKQVVSCPSVCTLESCNETGRHYHDGVQYCGYAHSGGYCDGSCLTSVNGSWQGSHHGHHGHHGGHH